MNKNAQFLIEVFEYLQSFVITSNLANEQRFGLTVTYNNTGSLRHNVVANEEASIFFETGQAAMCETVTITIFVLNSKGYAEYRYFMLTIFDGYSAKAQWNLRIDSDVDMINKIDKEFKFISTTTNSAYKSFEATGELKTIVELYKKYLV